MSREGDIGPGSEVRREGELGKEGRKGWMKIFVEYVVSPSGVGDRNGRG